jgi:hypothetical protein
MPVVFVSYRRADLVACALLRGIDERLVRQFGRPNVFVDVDSIPLGVDFRNFVYDNIARCEVVVALIGNQWLPLLNERASDPGDFVRIELEAALAKGVPVVPLLIGGAAMPTEAELPESIRSLAFRNAMVMDHGRDFNAHMNRLLNELEGFGQARRGDSRQGNQFGPIEVTLPESAYADLENELALGDWKEADLLTGRMMLRLARRGNEGWLDIAGVRSCPEEAVARIDELWTRYSEGKFGYSVQSRLYRELGGGTSFSRDKWREFSERVGWYKDGAWLLYNDMTFGLDAPDGHLPDGFVAVQTQDGSVVRCWVLAMA